MPARLSDILTTGLCWSLGPSWGCAPTPPFSSFLLLPSRVSFPQSPLCAPRTCSAATKPRKRGPQPHRASSSASLHPLPPTQLCLFPFTPPARAGKEQSPEQGGRAGPTETANEEALDEPGGGVGGGVPLRATAGGHPQVPAEDKAGGSGAPDTPRPRRGRRMEGAPPRGQVEGDKKRRREAPWAPLRLARPPWA